MWSVVVLKVPSAALAVWSVALEMSSVAVLEVLSVFIPEELSAAAALKLMAALYKEENAH